MFKNHPTIPLAAALLAGAVAFASPTASLALGEQDYIGSIELVGFSYCPEGTTEMRGQLLAVQNYQALYSLLGNRFGGDAGKGTFQLPNMMEVENGRYVPKAPVEGMRYCMVIDGDYPSQF